ncbi:MAG: hypothetical protein HY763_13795 [Planctomycetes bacterium]|nr:hypothetical protein [Planctomycetota bacterium]
MRSYQRRIAIGFLLGSFGAVGAPAPASPVTFGFTGEVTTVLDPFGLLQGHVSPGMPIHGAYTFESKTPDSLPTFPSSGVYENAIVGSEGQIGTLDYALFDTPSAANLIAVENNNFGLGRDRYLAASSNLFLAYHIGLNIELVDSSQQMFSSDALPLLPPSLDSVDSARFRMGTSEELRVLVTGELSSFFIVPEPATLVLAALSTTALAVLKN